MSLGEWWIQSSHPTHLAVIYGFAEIACGSEEQAQKALDHFSALGGGEIRTIEKGDKQ